MTSRVIWALGLVLGCQGGERGESLMSGTGGLTAGPTDDDDGGGPSDPLPDGDGSSTSGPTDDESSGGHAGSSGGVDSGDPPPPGDAPDCQQVWQGQYVAGASYMSMKVPETAAEMFCYVNMERINYSFHGRNDGCVWDGDGNGPITWPFEMQYDAGLAAAAQAEADAIVAGGSPAGQAGGGGANFLFFVDGCASELYTISSVGDSYDDWPEFRAPLSKGNGSARMGIFYYDPGVGSPTLTKLGVGLALDGDLRTWVLKFGL